MVGRKLGGVLGRRAVARGMFILGWLRPSGAVGWQVFRCGPSAAAPQVSYEPKVRDAAQHTKVRFRGEATFKSKAFRYRKYYPIGSKMGAKPLLVGAIKLPEKPQTAP